jgi:hypothetical protein
MRYLQNFTHLAEGVKDSKSDLTASLRQAAQRPKTPLGFILHFCNKFYLGSTDTFHEFACEVVQIWGYVDEARYYFDFAYLLQDLSDCLDGSEQSVYDLEEAVLWTGLQPVGGKFFDMIDSKNPIVASEFIVSKFSNAKEILTKHPEGYCGSPEYLSRSIENDLSSLAHYANYDSSKPGEEYGENAFTLEEILNKLPKSLREQTPRLIQFYQSFSLM